MPVVRYPGVRGSAILHPHLQALQIGAISRYPEAGQEVHGQKAGSVITIEFELNGQKFTGLNGGPHFKLNEAISFQIMCKNQEEVVYNWNRLGQGGDPNAQQCGWLKDK